MPRLTFRLHISAEEMMRYYEGSSLHVSVTSREGVRLKFPALWLRSFVVENGVHGMFSVEYDSRNKLRELRYLGP